MAKPNLKPSPKALLLCGLLVLACLTRAMAQDKPINADAQTLAALKQQASAMTTALQKHDVNALLVFTYPKVMKMMGGKAKVGQNLQAGFDRMGQSGISITSVTPGEVKQVEQSGGRVYALLSYVLQGSAGGGIITHGSYLLGISANGGKRWYFIDAPVLKKFGTEKLFPNFPKDMVIPNLNTQGLTPD